MTPDQQAKLDAIRERLTPRPVDAWEQLYEQQVSEAWKRSKEQQCQTR